MSSIDLKPAPWPLPRRGSLIGDLREPDAWETPLSPEEVQHGLRKDLIPEGPRARLAAFRPATVTAVQHRVLVADIVEAP